MDKLTKSEALNRMHVAESRLDHARKTAMAERKLREKLISAIYNSGLMIVDTEAGIIVCTRKKAEQIKASYPQPETGRSSDPAGHSTEGA